MQCKHCKTKLPVGAKFCPACGLSIRSKSHSGVKSNTQLKHDEGKTQTVRVKQGVKDNRGTVIGVIQYIVNGIQKLSWQTKTAVFFGELFFCYFIYLTTRNLLFTLVTFGIALAIGLVQALYWVLPNKQQPKGIQWYQIIGGGYIATVLVLSILIGGGFIEKPPIMEYVQHGTPTPMSVPTAEPNEILFLVAGFDGQADYDPSDRIFQRLNDDLEQFPLSNVRVNQISETPKTSEEAERIGKAYNATVVIWGNYDSYGITPHYQIISSMNLVSTRVETVPTVSKIDSREFAIYISRNMGAELSYLSFFTLGQMAYFSGDYDKASLLLDNAISILPQSTGCNRDLGQASLYFFRGYIYQVIHPNLSEAIKAYRLALECQPNSVTLHYNLADALRRSGEEEQAIDEYTTALKLDHQHFQSYYSRGTMYLDQGELSSAIADFNMAVEIDPLSGFAHYARGIAYYQRGLKSQNSKDFKDAIVDFNISIKMNADNEDAIWGRANAYGLISEYDKAINDYMALVYLNSRYTAFAYNNIAWIYADDKKSHLDIAIDYAQRAISLAENQNLGSEVKANFMDTLGWAYYQAGDLDSAEEVLTAAHKSDPNNPTISDHLAIIQTAQ